MDKLSFKQFIIDSKTQLLSAINNVPVIKNKYHVNKYCTLVLESDDGEIIQTGLKPSHVLIVEWRYDTPTTPSLVSISVDNHDNLDIEDKYITTLTTEKLQKWLTRNTSKRNI